MPRPRLSYEVKGLLDELAGADGPMPPDDADDATWDAWATYQEFESAAVGLASRPVWAGAGPHLDRMQRLLADAGLRSLLGQKLSMAERLIDMLRARHSG